MYFVEKQRKAKQALHELGESRSKIYLIHYSCESFYDTNGRTPRVTSIACREFLTGQTRSFSIHQISEFPDFKDKSPSEQYDQIEKVVLDKFFEFVEKQVEHVLWVHWNMRDINYGFAAIEHRYEVLGGKPTLIPNTSKQDLSRILFDLYGSNYAPHPRLENLMNLNKISNKDFLSGKEEAKAYNDHQYLSLHQSTLRKIDVLSSILDLTLSNRLKTHASFWDLHGGLIRLIWEKYVLSFTGKLITALVSALSLIEWMFPQAKTYVANFFSGLLS